MSRCAGARGNELRASSRGLQVLSLVLSVTFAFLTACAPPRSSHIVIGSKDFTEQTVLGELLAQEIEAAGGGPVERRFWLAGSYLCQQALVADRIDAYPEYTGTALTAILKQPLPKPGSCDEACVHAKVAQLYEQRYQVREGPGLGFEDTFAMVMRADDARRYGLRTISDIAKMQREDAGLSTAAAKNAAFGRDDTSLRSPMKLRLGVGYEFAERPDGLRGLSAAYGLHFAEAPRTMELGLLYRALAEHQVDIVAGNSTDAAIAGLGFVVLEDDRHYFPPYEAVPLVREDSLARWPQIGVAIQRLAGKVSAEDMRALNLAVEVKHQDVGEVVREYRRTHGL